MSEPVVAELVTGSDEFGEHGGVLEQRRTRHVERRTRAVTVENVDDALEPAPDVLVFGARRQPTLPRPARPARQACDTVDVERDGDAHGRPKTTWQRRVLRSIRTSQPTKPSASSADISARTRSRSPSAAADHGNS